MRRLGELFFMRPNASGQITRTLATSTVTVNTRLAHPILRSLPALNELSLRYPKAISLGSGRPADQFCQPEKIQGLLKHFQTYAEQHKPTPYNQLIGQYTPSAGIINEIVAKHLEVDEAIKVSPQDIVITLGFQEAIELCVKVLFNKNDVLIIPDPIFVGVTGSAILSGVNIQPFKWKGGVFNKTEFAKVLSEIRKKGLNPKALYVIPDFSNPYGECLPLKDRQALLEWAKKEGIFILEDNAYSVFRYQGTKIPTLKALDKEKRVVYLGTAAKTVYPGLRIGYVVAEGACVTPEGTESKLAAEFAKAKCFNTVNTPPLQQALFASVLLSNEYSLQKFNQPQVDFNKKNLECAQNALLKCFPREKYPAVTWNKPEGGYFIVINLPFIFGLQALEECAQKHGVIVIPLEMFSFNSDKSTEVRISFTNMKPEVLEEAIIRFSEYVKSKLDLKVKDTIRARL